MPDIGQQMTYPILIRFAKTGLMRFIGHLDWQALQQAMFLKAGLGIAVGEGPTHRLRMKTSPPTPVGVASRTELTYLLLADPLYPEEAARRLDAVCPDGIEVVAVKDAGRLARKNPFGTIEATLYDLDLGDRAQDAHGTQEPSAGCARHPGTERRMRAARRDENADTRIQDVVSELERIRSAHPPDESEPDEFKAFWGRILEIEPVDGSIRLLALQREAETFHAAKCATYLEKHLSLPHYPIFTKLDYFRLKPSKRRLFA
jgi:radical SAM-linked protein